MPLAPSSPRPPLAGIRVLDLATPRAELAGRVLADLGAEVIKIEPPEGSPARRLPPFVLGREGDPESSLYWASVALGKRSVVLDIAEQSGRDALRVLIEAADVLIESDDPGRLESLGLGYGAAAELNPGLVYVSVTPYGQDGPDAHSPATDLTLEAAGGLMGLQGDGDRPPLPVGYPQAAFQAGVQAAADTIIALNERAASEHGQHLDVSIQAAVAWTLMNASGFPAATGANVPGYCETRAGPRAELVPGLVVPIRHACSDGVALSSLKTGVPGARTVNLLMRWLEEERWPMPEGIAGRDWTTWREDLMSGALKVEQAKEALAQIDAFLATKPMRTVLDRAVRDTLVLAPFLTIDQVVDDPQLASRDYWLEIGGRRHPGAFARLTRTPLDVSRPAPCLGADQDLLTAPRRAPTSAAARRGGGRRLAFDGLKVADFAWVGVGPIISKALADHGATVVHVESPAYPDVLRGLPPFKDNLPGVDRSQFFANFNTSKLGVTIDFASDKGRELALRLVDWSDVMVESFIPGTLARRGLDWETLAQRRSDLIMLSTCLRGQTGPERAYGGFGGQGAGLAGIASLTGWPDRAAVGPYGAYTDFIAPRYGVAAIAAAILERRTSGLGQHIDLSQVEAAMHLIEPLLLDQTVNGRTAGRAGHESATAAPHGAYRCAGDERYVAIACETPEHWRALRSIAPLGVFSDSCYDDLGFRLAADSEIDAALERWCCDQDDYDLAARLKRAGVPAAVVQWPSDMQRRDAQLAHRGFFVTLDHPVMGPMPYDGFVTRFSATPPRLATPGPCLGEHTMQVLEDVLGLSMDEIADYAAAGALG